MNPVEKIIATILIILIVLLFTWPLIIAETWNVGAGRQSSVSVLVDSIADTIKNGNNYDKYAKDYMKSKFGEVVLSKMIVSIGGRVENHKYAYRVRFDDILSKNFVVYVSSNGGCTDTFSETLTTDPKFQHLYSEWVKKQVGIDDKNVELKFYGQQSDPKIAIEFNQIKYLNNNYDEIFKNLHNFYCSEIKKKYLTNLNEQNSYEISNRIIEEYFNKIKELVGTPTFKFSCRIGLSNNEFLKDDLNIYYRHYYSGNIELKRVDW